MVFFLFWFDFFVISVPNYIRRFGFQHFTMMLSKNKYNAPNLIDTTYDIFMALYIVFVFITSKPMVAK